MSKERNYPLWLYHREKPEGLICESAEHEEQLGKGWVESPAEFEKPKADEKADQDEESKSSEESQETAEGFKLEDEKPEVKSKKGKK